MDKQLKSGIVQADLENAGFATCRKSNADIVVSLKRRISASEVQTALLEAGYTDELFALDGLGDGTVIVRVIV